MTMHKKSENRFIFQSEGIVRSREGLGYKLSRSVFSFRMDAPIGLRTRRNLGTGYLELEPIIGKLKGNYYMTFLRRY